MYEDITNLSKKYKRDVCCKLRVSEKKLPIDSNSGILKSSPWLYTYTAVVFVVRQSGITACFLFVRLLGSACCARQDCQHSQGASLEELGVELRCCPDTAIAGEYVPEGMN